MATKSLGTLTLDLVARVGGFTGPLDKASRESQKRMAEIKKSAEAAGKAIGYIGTAAAAGLAALTVDTVRTANEITRLSAVANSSTEEFQRYAAAASAVGIEQDKLADIFKDVNDKVGDFMQTGGGALADFFENIAPQVGVTADQFKKLSGPEALGLYVSSLEKAGASQQEMTFYLEAIASDATALLPLLENNAEGFKTLGEAAAQAGAILDEDAIRAANELAAVSFLADQALTGMKNQIVSGLLPVLSDLAAEFVDVSSDGETFEGIGEDIGKALKGVTAAAVGAYSYIQLYGKGLAGLAFIASEVPNGLDAVKNAVAIVGDELDETAQKAGAAIQRIMSAGEDGQTNKRVELLATVIEASNEATARSGVVLSKATEETKKNKKAKEELTEEQKKQNEALEAYQRLVKDLRTDEEQLTDQLKERLAVIDAAPGVSDADRRDLASRAIGASFTDAPGFEGSDSAVTGAAGEFGKLNDAQQALDEWYEAQIERLNQYRQDRADLTAEWDAQELELKQQHEEGLARIEQDRQLVALSAAESTFSTLSSMAAQFAGEQSALYKTLFIAEKAAAIARATIAIQEGIALAAANPFPLNLAAMASVAAATAGLVGNIAAVGMAHDGIDSVPQDGTWLLQKGERVTTAETSAKLDNTLNQVSKQMDKPEGSKAPIVNLYEDSSKAGQASSRMQDEQFILDVFVANINTDGRASKAIGQSFGVRRAGR